MGVSFTASKLQGLSVGEKGAWVGGKGRGQDSRVSLELSPPAAFHSLNTRHEVWRRSALTGLPTQKLL